MTSQDIPDPPRTSKEPLGWSWEVLGDPDKSLEVLEGHGRFLGGSWEVLAGLGISWKVMGGHVRSCEVM